MPAGMTASAVSEAGDVSGTGVVYLRYERR
jgi:hypothetical protein